MIDTYGRKYFNSIIDLGAKFFLKLNFTPNSVTVIALITGVFSSVLLLNDYNYMAIIVLWLSGYLDSVDGAMARMSSSTSAYGTLLDITFDRIVELSLIFSLAFRFEESRIYLMFLMGAILISMTIFLTVGALAKNNGIKSFKYQAGIAERTEGFLMFSLMIIFKNSFLITFINLFTIIIVITIFQRIYEAKKILQKEIIQ